MRAQVLIPAIPFLIATAAFAQIDRTFTLANAPSALSAQELATVLRTVGNIKQLSIGPASSSVSISGSAGDISMAEWLVHEMDQPVSGGEVRETAVHEYVVPDGKDDVVRMFYLAHIDTPQEMQELITVLRTVGQVQKIFNYTALNALAVRGTADKIALSAWVVQELDRISGTQTPGTHEFVSSDKSTPVLRVFYLMHNRTTKDMQEALTAIRMNVRVQFAFNFSALGAVVAGGSASQMEQVAQLIEQRDQVAAR